MRTLTGRFVLRLHGRMRSEGGFTLIELMVALGVVLVALVAMAYLATVGFTDIALARQRQGANGLANQTMEQIRALPFDELRTGLANTDLAGDANVTKNGPCAGTGTWFCYAGEQIPHGARTSNVVPLFPHIQTLIVGKTTYTVRAYVTWYNNVTTSQTFRLTVLVTWPNAARQGISSSVQTQSVAYSGAGCLSTKTHPFAAPCQPFFYGNATAGQGHFDVTGTIEGIQLQTASLLLTGESSNVQIEQISAVQGIATASGASLTLTSQAAQVSAGQQVTSGADNDPAQPGQEYDSVLATGSGGALTADSGGVGNSNTLTLTPSTGDPLATTSTTSASLVGNLCPLFGISENDQQPCGSSTAQQIGTASAALSLKKQLDLGTMSLVTVLPAPSAGASLVNREIQTGADGLIHSDVARHLGTVTLASLPSGLDPAAVPVGWAGYLVQVSGVTETVTAETGTNTAAPTVAASGTISYWNGAGYSSLTLAPGNSVNLPVASVHILTLVGGKILQIDVQGSSGDCNLWVLGCPTTGGSSTAETLQTCSPVPCPNTRSSATAQSGSPFIGDLRYTVTYNGSVLSNLTIHVDFGSLLAQNTYQVAPSAV